MLKHASFGVELWFDADTGYLGSVVNQERLDRQLLLSDQLITGGEWCGGVSGAARKLVDFVLFYEEFCGDN